MSVTRLFVAFAMACTASPPTPAPSATTVPLEVNGAPITPITVPEGDGPWPLLGLLPADAPKPEAVKRIEVRNEAGRWLEQTDPSGQVRELAFSWRDGQPAISLLASPRAAVAREPLQTVLSPSVVRLHTEERVDAAAPWPLLEVLVDDAPQGRLLEAELAPVARTKMPGREEREGGWALVDVVALRHPVDQIASVALHLGEGEPVVFTHADLTGPQLLLLRATQKGTWTLKDYPSAQTREPTRTLKDVREIRIRSGAP